MTDSTNTMTDSTYSICDSANQILPEGDGFYSIEAASAAAESLQAMGGEWAVEYRIEDEDGNLVHTVEV